MPKPKRLFICENCDAQFPKWEGRCRECGKWSTLKETTIVPQSSSVASNAAVVNLAEVTGASAAARFSSGYAEFDRVLGGGFVPGELILVGGDPGIGKSTLLLQVAKNLATSAAGVRAPSENVV